MHFSYILENQYVCRSMEMAEILSCNVIEKMCVFTQRKLLLMRSTADASVRLVATACGISSDKRIV